MSDPFFEELPAKLPKLLFVFRRESESESSRVKISRRALSGCVDQLSCLNTVRKVGSSDAVVSRDLFLRRFRLSRNDRNRSFP